MLQCLSSKHQFYSFVQTFLRFQMLSYLSSCTQQVNIKKKAGDGGGKEEEGRRGGEKPLYYTVHTIFSISKKTNNPNKNILNKKPNAQKIKKQNITNAAKFACRKKAHQHHLSLHTHVDFRVGRCISQLPDRTQMAQSGALEEILVKTLSYLQRCGWTKRSQKTLMKYPRTSNVGKISPALDLKRQELTHLREALQSQQRAAYRSTIVRNVVIANCQIHRAGIKLSYFLVSNILYH